MTKIDRLGAEVVKFDQAAESLKALGVRGALVLALDAPPLAFFAAWIHWQT